MLVRAPRRAGRKIAVEQLVRADPTCVVIGVGVCVNGTDANEEKKQLMCTHQRSPTGAEWCSAGGRRVCRAVGRG